jgi:hypothetical protein
MQVRISVNDQGEIVVETPQGPHLTECFFKAEDETPEELRHMGYHPLVLRYPTAQIVVGPGLEPGDLAEIFVGLEATHRVMVSQSESRPALS